MGCDAYYKNKDITKVRKLSGPVYWGWPGKQWLDRSWRMQWRQLASPKGNNPGYNSSQKNEKKEIRTEENRRVCRRLFNKQVEGKLKGENTVKIIKAQWMNTAFISSNVRWSYEFPFLLYRWNVLLAHVKNLVHHFLVGLYLIVLHLFRLVSKYIISKWTNPTT